MDFYETPEDGPGKKFFKMSSGFMAGLTLTYLANFNRITRPYIQMRSFEEDERWYQTIYRFGAEYLTVYTEYGISGMFQNMVYTGSEKEGIEDLEKVEEYLDGEK